MSHDWPERSKVVPIFKNDPQRRIMALLAESRAEMEKAQAHSRIIRAILAGQSREKSA